MREVYVSLLHVQDEVKEVKAFSANKLAEAWCETEDSMVAVLPNVDPSTVERTTMMGHLVVSGAIDIDAEDITWPDKVWITIQAHKNTKGETVITPKVFLEEASAKDHFEIQEKRGKVAKKEELQITLFKSELDSTIMV